MKQLFFAFAVMISMSASAQKFATVNSQEILLTMPEVKAMQAKLQAKTEELTKQLETMSKAYDSKLAELKAGEATMSKTIKDSKIQELQDLEARIQKFQQAAQGEVQEMEKTLTAPLVDKAKKAITEESKVQGYTHVFDLVSGSLLVWPDTNDITGAVKKRLGIDPNAKPAMGGGQGQGAPAGGR
jgi:outer membrane protein